MLKFCAVIQDIQEILCVLHRVREIVITYLCATDIEIRDTLRPFGVLEVL